MAFVSIDNRTSCELPLDEYEALALFVLGQKALPEKTELSISLVENEEIQALNREFRGVDEPTDVLSFPCDELDGDSLDVNEFDSERPEEAFLLGDLIIAPAVAQDHAEDFDSSLEDEMALLIVHGILHLFGYDHVEDDDFATMNALENDLLDTWGERDMR